MSETLTPTSIPEQHEHHSNQSSDSGSLIEADRSADGIEDTAGDFQKDFVRAEIDSSAPFESVKEAVSRFGGIGFWKPRSRKTEHELEDIDISEVEKQKSVLAANLVEKESETSDLLKELERTTRLAERLESRLQKEQSEHDTGSKVGAADSNGLSVVDAVISRELDQEKMKRVSATEASIEMLKESIASERNAIEATRQRLATNSLNISSLEKELTQTRIKIESVKDIGADEVSATPFELSEEIQRLSSETEELKIVGEAAKSELFSAMLDIEQTKSRIKIAEMSLAAANRMKEAAKQAKEAALSKLNLLTNDESPAFAKPEGVSLSQEEYEALVARAREAEHLSYERVQKVMQEVDEANKSKMEMLMKVERATEEVKLTKLVMENALRRVETANMGKLAVEESLRQRRSDHPKRRRSYSNSTKFKTVGPSQYRKEHSLHDVNGLSLVSDNSVPVLRPTLSIGQILNNKLQQLDQPAPEINYTNRALKRHESLGEMLSRRDENSNIPIAGKPEKATDTEPTPRKANKFKFARLSLQLASQSKNKKTAATPRFMMCKGEP